MIECDYGRYLEDIDMMLCTKSGREVYTNCHKSVCGELPGCVYEPLDNSPEAVRRRVEWMRGHAGLHD